MSVRLQNYINDEKERLAEMQAFLFCTDYGTYCVRECLCREKKSNEKFAIWRYDYECMDDFFDSCWCGVQFGGTDQDTCLAGYAKEKEKNCIREDFFIL